jgi:hypothetical protein
MSCRRGVGIRTFGEEPPARRRYERRRSVDAAPPARSTLCPEAAGSGRPLHTNPARGACTLLVPALGRRLTLIPWRIAPRVPVPCLPTILVDPGKSLAPDWSRCIYGKFRHLQWRHVCWSAGDQCGPVHGRDAECRNHRLCIPCDHYPRARLLPQCDGRTSRRERERAEF